RPYELRVEIRSDNKDYVALYKTFKLENEANKYRIRLGKVTSSIDGGRYGLSYSNNAKFSTFDKDNDDSSLQCAVSNKGGWWYKSCEYSKLNAPWRDGKIISAWRGASKILQAVSTSMKIRPFLITSYYPLQARVVSKFNQMGRFSISQLTIIDIVKQKGYSTAP
ncbi:angiopoietin-related protein 1, partial [Elysia marginata]